MALIIVAMVLIDADSGQYDGLIIIGTALLSMDMCLTICLARAVFCCSMSMMSMAFRMFTFMMMFTGTSMIAVNGLAVEGCE